MRWPSADSTFHTYDAWPWAGTQGWKWSAAMTPLNPCRSDAADSSMISPGANCSSAAAYPMVAWAMTSSSPSAGERHRPALPAPTYPCRVSLQAFVEEHRRLFVLTGAGCSTESGIPDYRDGDGAWKRQKPIEFQPFMRDPVMRARYWARSLIGWRSFGKAEPNLAHRSLATLERAGPDRAARHPERRRAPPGGRLAAGHRPARPAGPGGLHVLQDRLAPYGMADPPGAAQRGVDRSAGAGRTGRRRRPRRARLQRVRRPDLPAVRRHHQAGRGVLRRERAALAAHPGHRRVGLRGRHARRRLVADGVLRLPVRRRGDPARHPGRGGQPRAVPAPTICCGQGGESGRRDARRARREAWWPRPAARVRRHGPQDARPAGASGLRGTHRGIRALLPARRWRGSPSSARWRWRPTTARSGSVSSRREQAAPDDDDGDGLRNRGE